MDETADVETVYCRDCGAEIRAQAEICPECGIRQQPPETTTQTSQNDPGLAAVASVFAPGLGQIYNGEILKGILAGITVIGLSLTILGLVIAIPLWIWLIYDAYKTADTVGEPTIATTVQGDATASSDDSVDDLVLEVLEWYQTESSEGGMVQATARRYRNADSLNDLSEDKLKRLAKALEAYQAEFGAVPGLEAAQNEVRAQLETADSDE